MQFGSSCDFKLVDATFKWQRIPIRWKMNSPMCIWCQECHCQDWSPDAASSWSRESGMGSLEWGVGNGESVMGNRELGGRLCALLLLIEAIGLQCEWTRKRVSTQFANGHGTWKGTDTRPFCFDQQLENQLPSMASISKQRFYLSFSFSCVLGTNWALVFAFLCQLY